MNILDKIKKLLDDKSTKAISEISEGIRQIKVDSKGKKKRVMVSRNAGETKKRTGKSKMVMRMQAIKQKRSHRKRGSGAYKRSSIKTKLAMKKRGGIKNTSALKKLRTKKRNK